jgi:organic hydroperoxide reductase OsmC/OhrA
MVMSEHSATVTWNRENREFTYEQYSRDHKWVFGGGIEVPASAAPAFLGSTERVDPEEAFVAALSSCHMLTFLAIAAKKRFTVESYDDNAVGFLEKNAEGKLAVTRVILRPIIVFGGEKQPDKARITRMHHQSHEHCFIASTVKTEVTVDDQSERL